MRSVALLAGHAARTVTAAEFKATCLALMDEVRDKELEIIITKRGKPMPVWCPCHQQRYFHF